jgi:hypothetical protein
MERHPVDMSSGVKAGGTCDGGLSDAISSVGVRHDRHLSASSLLDASMELLQREVSVLGTVLGASGSRHEGPRGEHLDPVGAELDFVAHRLYDLIVPISNDAIGEAARAAIRGKKV